MLFSTGYSQNEKVNEIMALGVSGFIQKPYQVRDLLAKVREILDGRVLRGSYFGPAGWSYADWRGTVYPEPLPARFNHLAFLAGQFDFVEVNTSFYRIPAPDPDQGLGRTRPPAFPDFRFWLKLHQSFTHERQLDKPMLDGFRDCLRPLADAGKLAGLLAQFPYSFKFEPANLDYLRRAGRPFPCLAAGRGIPPPKLARG